MTTVTTDVIRDLLPAYVSGEASDDTRRLVESFLEADPSFAEEARAWIAATTEIPPVEPVRGDADGQTRALRRTKRILRWQQLWLALASTFTLNAVTLGFSFRIEAGHVAIQWMALPGQSAVVVFVAIVAAGFWVVYAANARRIRTRILG
jgi:anti-sigma factor RsiW